MTALEISPWTERWAGCIASKENNGKLAHAQYHGQRRKGFIGRLPQAILHHPQFKAFPIIFSSTVKIVYSRSTVTEHFCVEKTVTVEKHSQWNGNEKISETWEASVLSLISRFLGWKMALCWKEKNHRNQIIYK